MLPGTVWRLIFTLIFALWTRAAVAYPGQVDPTFVGPRTGYGGGAAMAVQPDGKIVFGRTSAGTANFTPVPTVYRMNADGTLDSTFNAPTASWFSGILTLAVEPDGKIMVGGQFSGANPERLGVARLNSDGSLDPTFQLITGSRTISGSTVTYGWVNAIVRRPDGRYIVGGNFNTCGGVATNYLAGLNADGSRDNSFQVGTGFDGSVASVALQADGKLIVGGGFSNYNGAAAGRIARLNVNGTLDTTFNTVAGFDNGVTQVALAANGTVLVRGSFTKFNGSAAPPLTRLLATGARDTTLVNASITRVSGFVAEPDGRLLVSGERMPSYTIPTLFRLENDGTLSSSFTPVTSTGQVGTDFASLQEVNGFIYAGASSSVNGKRRSGVAVFDQAGGLQDAFRPVGPSTGIALARRPDGHFFGVSFSGASFDEADSLSQFEVGADGHYLRRINLGYSVSTYSFQADGKLLVAFGGVQRRNADFTNDPTFTYRGPANLGFTYVAQLANGRVLACGSGSNNGTAQINTIVRLNSNGSLDTSFTAPPMQGGYGGVASFLEQPDGKIIITGSFSLLNGTPRPGLARLNVDGTLDQSFVPNGYTSFGAALALQADGRVIVGGAAPFIRDDVDGVRVLPTIGRLLPDGSADPSFQPLLGADGDVRAAVVQPDGRIIIGGAFHTYNGVPRGFLARLKTDGSLDSTFDSGPGLPNPPAGAVNALWLQPDGKLIVNGNFSSMGGEYTPFLARVETAGSAPAPIISAPGAVTAIQDEDTVFNVDFTATAPNGETVTWSASTPQFGTVNLTPSGNTVHVTFTPGADRNGRETVAVIARNPAGFADSAVFDVLFTPVNDPPVMRAAPVMTAAPIVGVLLSPGTGYFDDSKDGGGPVTMSYQWQAADDAAGTNTAAIPSATERTFVPTGALAGRFIRLQVTATDSGVGLPAKQSTSAVTEWAQVHQPMTISAWCNERFGGEAGNPLISGAKADPDGDGICNLFEYFFGTSPLARESSQDRIVIGMDPAAGGIGSGSYKYLTLTYRYSPAGQDVIVSYEASYDLAQWAAVSVDEVSRSHNADGTVTVKVRDQLSSFFTPRRYLRLKLSIH